MPKIIVTGKQGLAGANGNDGTSWRIGLTDPLPELGNNGDSYLNEVTYDLFTKTAGQWVKTSNIIKYVSFWNWIASSTEAGYILILIAGQSNSIGQTNITLNLTDRRQIEIITRMFQIRANGDLLAPVPILNTVTPENSYQLNFPDTNYSISPVVFFAAYYLIQKGFINQSKRILFVPCSVGGTGFEDPAVTNVNSWTYPAGSLYLNTVRRLQLAMSWLLPNQTVNHNIMGFICFNQAEKNVGTPAETYTAWWMAFMFAIRRSIPLTQSFTAIDRTRVPIVNVMMPSGSQSFLLAKRDMVKWMLEMTLAMPYASTINPDADLENDAGGGYITITSYDSVNNTVTFNRNHSFIDGEMVTGFSNSGELAGTGLESLNNIWPIVINATTIAVASSKRNWVNNTRVTITADPTGAAWMPDSGTRRDDLLHNNNLGIYRLDKQLPDALTAAWLNRGNIPAPIIDAVAIAPTEMIVYSDQFYDEGFGGGIPHQVQYRLQGETTWLVGAEGSKASAFLLTGLEQGATYEVRALSPDSLGNYTLAGNTVTVPMVLSSTILDAAWIGATASNTTIVSGLVSEWRSTKQIGASPWVWSQATANNRPTYLTGTSTPWPLQRPCINFAGNGSPSLADFLSGDANVLAWTAGKRWLMPMFWHFHTGLTSANGYIAHWGTNASGEAIRASYRATGNTTFSASTSLAPADNANRVFQPASPPANRDTYSSAGYFCDLADAASLARGRTFYEGVQGANGTMPNTFGTNLVNTPSAAANLFDSRNTVGSMRLAAMALLSGTSAPPANIEAIAKAVHYYLRSN